jgi:hypothetical protein
MKKTILILATLILSISCSKEVDEYDPAASLDFLNFQNSRLNGVWYFDKVIKPDGSIEDYIHICPNNKDYFDFQWSRIRSYRHTVSDNCTLTSWDVNCTNYITDGYNLTNCSSLTNGFYTLSGNSLRIDYDEVITLPFQGNNLHVTKGIILSRE